MYYTNIIKSISARGLFTLLALIMSISLHAQNATVKGVIVDETRYSSHRSNCSG